MGGYGKWYDGGELIHLLYLLSIEQPRTWTSLSYKGDCEATEKKTNKQTNKNKNKNKQTKCF